MSDRFVAIQEDVEEAFHTSERPLSGRRGSVTFLPHQLTGSCWQMKSDFGIPHSHSLSPTRDRFRLVAIMDLLISLQNLLQALFDVGEEFFWLVLPLTPLVLWVAFWLFGVNWVKLRSVLLSGGAIGVLLIMFMAILTWGAIAPPESGRHAIVGLSLSNFVGKTVYVTALAVIALLCGSVQLAGLCGSLGEFDDEPTDAVEHSH